MRCAMCQGAIIPSGVGRSPRWCSDRCRYRAHNRLRTLKAKREAAEAEGLVRRVAYLEEWIGRLESSPLRRSRMSI